MVTVDMASRVASEAARLRAAYARRGPPVSWANPAYVFNMQEREREVLRLLARHRCLPITGKTILDVGCGTGAWLQQFVKWGALPEHLTGIDQLPESVAQAARHCAQGVRVQCGSATALPFPAGSFDLVVQATVFTSVLDPEVKRAIAREMLRVLRPDGLIVWYDFHVNNSRNPDVRGVRRREIRELFPDCALDVRRITLAPLLARRVAPYSWLAAYVLARIPVLRTHYLVAIRKCAAS